MAVCTHWAEVAGSSGLGLEFSGFGEMGTAAERRSGGVWDLVLAKRGLRDGSGRLLSGSLKTPLLAGWGLRDSVDRRLGGVWPLWRGGGVRTGRGLRDTGEVDEWAEWFWFWTQPFCCVPQ